MRWCLDNSKEAMHGIVFPLLFVDEQVAGVLDGIEAVCVCGHEGTGVPEYMSNFRNKRC